LIALLLPAVQAAREAARRSQCVNNFKQICLGLQEYGDVFKMFPQDALWGNVQGNPNNPAPGAPPAVGAPQGPNRETWCVAIFPFVEQRPLYDAINKRTSVLPGAGTGPIGTAGQPLNGQVAVNNVPPNYSGQLIGQVLPNFRCPSDGTVTDPDMLGGFSHTNYAGAQGVYWPRAIQPASPGAANPNQAWVSDAISTTKGIFDWSAPCPFGAIRDGLSNTIIIGEVTSTGAGQPINPGGQFVGNTMGTTEAGNVPGAAVPMAPWIIRSTGQDNVPATANPPTPPDGPMPPLYYKAFNPYSVPFLPNQQSLAGGTGKSRALLLTSNGLPACWVFRSLVCSLVTTQTGEAPMNAPTGAYGTGIFPTFGIASFGNTTSWEFSYNYGGQYSVGYKPTFNGIFGPNSNWESCDSNHPGIVLVSMADGSSRQIQSNIDHTIWCQLNTRAGGEAITTEF